ncbi:hypothetical protein NUW58_g607 [Xylaria curta]|uniref:Uncharacterized protein n=1 Tax=Xylaria curta TaxID=42375 RepID=A0ACC1PRD1_9PEZI|nr:hypothetical protein NUW58_g607 [Xylaria curta]
MKLLATLLSAMAASATVVVASPKSSESAREVALRLKVDSTGNGFLQLGVDGVLRAYSAGGGAILDAAPLSPLQIEELAARGRAIPKINAVMPDYTGVDGRNVPEAELLNPPPEVAAAVVARGLADLTSAASPLTRRQDCGNIICTGDGVCTSNGCVFCIFFVPGIGACV